MLKFGRTIDIKEHCYFDRGPETFENLWMFKLFWLPPLFGFETLNPPPFLELQNFFDPLSKFLSLPTEVFMNAPLYVGVA